jgi:hypothetical protein
LFLGLLRGIGEGIDIVAQEPAVTARGAVNPQVTIVGPLP